jgi:hypothetical protein
MKSAAAVAILPWVLATGLAACGEDERGRGAGEPGDIQVSADQEQAMCDMLIATVGTGPVPITAGADMESAPGIDAQPGKKPVTLTDFEGQNGGYLRLSIDPANNTPVFIMFDDPMPFEVVREDGEVVDFDDAAEGSDLCDAAAGRYTWWVSVSENYLLFGPTEQLNFDLVLEVVD